VKARLRPTVTKSDELCGLRMGVSANGLELQIFIPVQAIAEHLYPFRSGRREFNIRNFSPRQRQVFDLLVDGKVNKEIAQAMNISVSCAKFHVRCVLHLLGVGSRLDVFRFYGKRAKSKLEVVRS
jgi:DNA-binding NarL/FixJ family response regulator